MAQAIFRGGSIVTFIVIFAAAAIAAFVVAATKIHILGHRRKSQKSAHAVAIAPAVLSRGRQRPHCSRMLLLLLPLLLLLQH